MRGEARAQRAARDVLHGEDARLLVEVVDGDDARVAERGGDAPLGEEAPARVGPRRARELRVQDLERDVDAERLVGREVDGGRGAASELVAEPVAQRRQALGRDERLAGAHERRGRLGAERAEVDARLGVVDVVGEDALPAQHGLGDARRPPRRGPRRCG